MESMLNASQTSETWQIKIFTAMKTVLFQDYFPLYNSSLEIFDLESNSSNLEAMGEVVILVDFWTIENGRDGSQGDSKLP